MTKTILALSGLVFIVAAAIFIVVSRETPTITDPASTARPQTSDQPAAATAPQHPMAIEGLRKREYQGSEIIIEQTLSAGSNYNRYLASYRADGLKINGLLTIPTTPKPEKGYPAIAFLHGYIAPNVYRTAERYVAYQDGFARNGFVTFKIDMRGHDKSEGEATTAHYSSDYVVDTLYAIASLKIHKDVDPNRIGAWGHSNGGEIGLRTMVISKDVKAGVFWAGVVGSFPDMLETYNSLIPFMQETPDLVKQNGKPTENPKFWDTIDPYAYLKDISGPVQLHHGTADPSVPIQLSRRLDEELKKIGKPVELYEYQGGDHNLSGAALGPAIQRSIEFFKTHL